MNTRNGMWVSLAIGLMFLLASIVVRADRTQSFEQNASRVNLPLSIEQLVQIADLRPSSAADIGRTESRGLTIGSWNYEVSYAVTSDRRWRITGYSAEKAIKGEKAADVLGSTDDGLVNRFPVLGPGDYPGPGDIPKPSDPSNPDAPRHDTGSSCPLQGFPDFKASWDWVWVPSHEEPDPVTGVPVVVPGHWELRKYAVEMLSTGCS